MLATVLSRRGILAFGASIVVLVAALWSQPPAFAASCTSNATGNWDNTATWTGCGDSIPGTGDSVTIQSGHIVTLDTDRTISSLSLAGTGTTSLKTLTLTSTGTALTLTDRADISSTFVHIALTGANGGSISVAGAQSTGVSVLQSLDLGSVSRTFNVANVGTGSDLIFSGIISGSGGVTKTGSGTLKYDATNTYTGDTDIQAGTLFIQGASSNDPVTRIPDGNTVQVSGGTLTLNNASETIQELILASGTVKTLPSGVGSATLIATSGYDVGSGTISVILGGSSALTKTTGGSVTLSGTNTYSGATNVNAGTLNIQNASALGSTSPGTTMASGATLQVQGGISIAEPLTLNGTLENVSCDNTWSGAVTAGSTVKVASETTLTVSGGITGTSLTKTGTGTLAFTTNGLNISGTLTVSDGTLSPSSVPVAAGGLTVSGGTFTAPPRSCPSPAASLPAAAAAVAAP